MNDLSNGCIIVEAVVLCMKQETFIYYWLHTMCKFQLAAPQKSRRMYLITDDGFTLHLTINLLVLISLIAVCISYQPLHNISLDIYYSIKEYMLQLCSQFAWWTLLGLLSSSCCAIQILLNALSFGCAGFNNVLGQIRPTFVALTIVSQFSSWYVLIVYSITYQQWRVTATSTVLSLVLTLLPEMLDWQTNKREERMIRNLKDYSTIKLQFKLSTLGCSSCVSTVSKVLDGIHGVVQHTVILENGTAEIVLDKSLLGMSEDTADVSTNDLWKAIANQLVEAGFPVDGLVEDSKKGN